MLSLKMCSILQLALFPFIPALSSVPFRPSPQLVLKQAVMRRPSQRRLANLSFFVGASFVIIGVLDLFPSVLSFSSITTREHQQHYLHHNYQLHSNLQQNSNSTPPLSPSQSQPQRLLHAIHHHLESSINDDSNENYTPLTLQSDVNDNNDSNNNNNDVNSDNQREQGTQTPVRADDPALMSCLHTKTNPHIIADSKGYLCSHALLDIKTGCCSLSIPLTQHDFIERYACSQCNMINKCCETYEHCVTCCFAPNQQASRSLIQSHILFRHYHIRSDFETCVAVCRSDSNSVVHENAYKHSSHHCFGLISPDIDPSLHRGVFDFTTPISSSINNHRNYHVRNQNHN